MTGIRARVRGELVTIRHGITRYKVTLVCFEANYLKGRFRAGHYPEARWVRPDELSEYPISSPQRKIAGELTRPSSVALF